MAINKGALFQDWSDRRAIKRVLDPVFRDQISEVVYADNRDGDGNDDTYPLLNFELWHPGLTSVGGDLAISEDQVYKLHNADSRSEFPRSNRIVACNHAFVPSDIGWRLLQPPLTFVDFEDGQKVFVAGSTTPRSRVAGTGASTH